VHRHIVQPRQGDGEACGEAFNEDLAPLGNLLSALFALNNAIINMQYDNGLAERLNKIKSFDPTKLDEEERAAHEAVDDFSRGISEIEIE
jgi:hypothetical protein